MAITLSDFLAAPQESISASRERSPGTAQRCRLRVASRKTSMAVNSIAEAGGKVTGVVADVRDFAAVGRAFETACSQFGSIDVLVSRAAGNFRAPINELFFPCRAQKRKQLNLFL
jgi:NAD(P)-dependent dehydrogenase (short-subunit alcohol dehydrogenase family)